MKRNLLILIGSFLALNFVACNEQEDHSQSPAVVLKSESATEDGTKNEGNLKKQKSQVMVSKELTTCLDLAYRILETSPHFIETTTGLRERIIKNGGTNFGVMLEGSPNPEEDGAMDFSISYDFQLYESYPDHSPVIHRYTFDPSFKQLYLYDPIEDELSPIDFDRKLLDKLKAFCK